MEAARRSREMPIPKGRELLDIVDQDYQIDSLAGITSPKGMSGRMLRLNTLQIHASSDRIQDARTAAEGARLEISEPVFAATCTADAVLDAPMDADSLGVGVMALKRRLREIGCFNGAVTPVYDAATVEAVKAFQKATGLPADGRASLETQRVLFDGESYIEE